MFFNSFQYLLFLPAVAVLHYIIPGKYQWLWLLACSVFFYLSVLPKYILVFFALVLMNYFLGQAIESADKKKNIIFITSICINIFILAFFKYFGLLQKLACDIKSLASDNKLLNIILPVGLSFFVFTIMSYLIELKRGTIKAEKHFGIFASSLLFFPKIMQGPIEKPGKVFHQFHEEKKFDYSMIVAGLKMMLWGYFLKLVVADRLALYVNAVYGNWEYHSGASLLVATFFYSIQIYADFAGYTNIALGSASLLGFNLTENFNRPYFATSIKEFWSRWHISLSMWLRDYLFLPLAVLLAGRSHRSNYMGISIDKWIFSVAALLTFAICGLWHGEGSNFLVWGLLFGVYLTISKWTLELRKKLRKNLHVDNKSLSYRIVNVLITFILVTFTWIFFRAGSLNDAIFIIGKIATDWSAFFAGQKTVLLYGFIGMLILILKEIRDEFFSKKMLFFDNSNTAIRYISYASMVILIMLIGVFDGGQFIYFQF